MIGRIELQSKRAKTLLDILLHKNANGAEFSESSASLERGLGWREPKPQRARILLSSLLAIAADLGSAAETRASRDSSPTKRRRRTSRRVERLFRGGSGMRERTVSRMAVVRPDPVTS